jgi:putative membrane protein
MNTPPSTRRPDSAAYAVIGLVSAAVLGVLFWLLYGRSGGQAAPAWASSLPAVNALCNTASACCLLAGVAAIRRGHRRQHVLWICTALLFSALFLIGYMTHHAYHGDTRFPGQGLIRPLYFTILISHVLLSIAALPMILTTVFLALTGRFDRHRRLARRTFPVWLYVSVSGVLVFLLLKAYT